MSQETGEDSERRMGRWFGQLRTKIGKGGPGASSKSQTEDESQCL